MENWRPPYFLSEAEVRKPAKASRTIRANKRKANLKAKHRRKRARRPDSLIR